MCRFSSSFSSLSHFLFPRDFSGTITDRDIINTPLEPLRPADVPFGGFVDTAHHFRGEIHRKPQLLKVSYFRNSCIDFDQILHNNGDHQVVVTNSANKRPTNPRWQMAAILKKNR